MTLRLLDSYSYLPSGAVAWRLQMEGVYPWPFNADLVRGYGALGGYALGFITGDTQWEGAQANYVFPQGTTAYVGARVNLPPGCKAMLNFVDLVAGVNQVTVVFDAADGAVSVWRGNFDGTGTMLAQTAPGMFKSGATFFIEAMATISPTVGQVIVRINGGLPTPNDGVVVDITNVNTQATANTYMTAVAPGATAYHGQVNFDSFYACDTAGSVNNGFLGNVKAEWLATAGPGATTQLTIGGSAPASTNWQSVQDYALDEAQYVTTKITGDEDLYTLQPIVTPGPIFGVQLRAAVRQDDATQIAAQNIGKSGATAFAGKEYLTSATYTDDLDIFETDPNTGVGWLAAAVNSLQIGQKKAA